MPEQDQPSTLPLVFLVNDDPLQLKRVAALLRRHGLDLRPFRGAEPALEALKGGATPRLIITDLYMPGLDGWRFCRLLRSPEFAAFNAIPILLMSATYAGDEADRLAAELGAEAFLPVPLDGDLLVEQVLGILQGNRPARLPDALIVEDSHSTAAYLKATFQEHGYRAKVVSTLAQARQALGATLYEVALLDYVLPDGHGDAVLDWLRREQPACVCLMMSGVSGPELALDWMKRGAAFFLRKPFEGGELMELVGRARRERALLRVQDILEVRTQELRRSEELFRSLADHSSDGILLIGPDHRVAYASPSFARQLGYTQEEALALVHPGIAAIVHPDDSEDLARQVQATIEQQQEYGKFTYRVQHRRGHYLWWEDSAKFLYDTQGLHLNTHVVCRDITEKRRAEAEEELRVAEAIQVQKMEALGRLAGGVAHDFNNMLCVIIGLSDLLLAKMDPEAPAAGPIQEIYRAANRSADLTRQLLAYARRQPVMPRILDLDEHVAGLVSMLKRLIGEDIQLILAPGASPWLLRMDPSQIDQLLVNLCVNARDAIGGTGRITVATAPWVLREAERADYPELADGDHILLTLGDDGPGMVEEVRARLFEPFFTTKGVGKGTGLGLSTVYGIVRQNGGAIRVDSVVGQGTTFRIMLPRGMAAARPALAAPLPSVASAAQATILVVDDEAAIRAMAARLLQEIGYDVLVAASSSEALKLLQNHPGEIHLLLTDVILTDTNGFNLAKLTRILRPAMRCLFMSGYALGPGDGQPAPSQSFLPKPFSLEHLALAVREALAKG